ncbi:MAG: sigma-70 family RNA polymerase sigma factor [Dysgonamonadaceae bacterium]|nr:sigma-70 family RNA polymerase sigma factor [Dysgonamonadaceae bacterium]
MLPLTNIQNLRSGKESALRELYTAFFQTLCVFGNRFLKDDAAVADIVQEVFIKVWDRRMDFHEAYSLRSFMYVSVRNACLNHLRDQKDMLQISLSDTLTEEFVEAEEIFVIEEEVHRMIRNEIDALPKAMKKVFDLTLMDMSIAEIATVLDLSENTVRNQRARAREILRKRLQDKLFLLFL